MTRSLTLITLSVTALFTLNPSAASAQDIPCPDGLVYVNTVGPDGIGYRVCAKSTRQATQAVGFMGVLDPGRSVSTHVDPNDASARVSASYGYGGVYGGQGGYYAPPPDPRLPWAISEAFKAGVTVTAFEDGFQAAADRGIRDGQHYEVMSRLDEIEAGYRAELSRLRTRLDAAVSLRNRELEAAFRARITDVERKLEEAKAPSGGSGPTPTPGEKTTPTPAADGGSGVREYFDRRLPQSRKR